jgi:hypothetical protein
MATKKVDFNMVLQKLEAEVKGMGLVIQYTQNMDPFFKGDLDGKTIFIGTHLSPEEKVFNLLHLSGHSIQWNVDELLRNLGSELYRNPDDNLLLRLQTYEWQANCYALTLLHSAGYFNMDKWLTRKYIIDMLYLTHFYKTGEKLKRITQVAKAYVFNRELVPVPVPSFIPVAQKRTRNGLVIAF